jgi:ABC-type glycerol-3-phosphate transport system permease component
MIDPVSAFALANAAYKAIKKGIEMGREIEDMGGQLGTWFGAVADVKAAEEEAKNPPLFKKLLYKGSVEQEAMQNLMRRKKIEQQEKELRELIVYRYGVDAYKDMIRDRMKIKETRTATEATQRRKMRNFIMNSATVAVIVGLIGTFVAFVAGILKNLR